MNPSLLRLLSFLIAAWTGWTFGWLLAVSLVVPYGLLTGIVVPVSRIAFALGAIFLLRKYGLGALSRAQMVSRGLGLVALNLWGSILSLAIALGGFDYISPWLTPIVALLLAALYLGTVALIIEKIPIARTWRWLAVAGSLILLTIIPVFFELISGIFGYQPTQTTHRQRLPVRITTWVTKPLSQQQMHPKHPPTRDS